jgi:hypothetical protein
VEVLVDDEVSLITSSSRIGSFLPKLFRGEGMEPGEPAGEAGINAELGLPRAIARLKCKPINEKENKRLLKPKFKKETWMLL